MSRFKQPERALAPLPPAQLGKGSTASVVEPGPPVIKGPAVAPGGMAVPQAVPRQEESRATKLGMLALCAVILSPYIQDLTSRLGFKPYLNIVGFIILPFAFLGSGQVFRAFRSSTGKAWLGFAFFATLSIPFSVWPGDSTTVMRTFMVQALSLFFFMCAFATSYRLCRWIVTTNLIAAVLVLINCAAFGDNSIGRVFIPGSYLLSNSNDLALALLINMGYFYYLVLKPDKPFLRLLGGVGMLACLYFILKTASRGGFLALGVSLLVLFIFSRNKFAWAVVVVPVLAASLALMPSNLIHRFGLILANPELSQAESESDVAAIESQSERQELMKKAIHYTLTRPLLGVGPGEFGTAVLEDEHKAGKHSPDLGTHNTYLEVSSECGLPAFFCYVAVVLACIRVNYRGLKRLRQRPDLADPARLAYCLLAIGAGFAVNIFFHHLAFSLHLPLLSGITACLNTVGRSGPVPDPPVA
jgi:O-antigen ligase